MIFIPTKNELKSEYPILADEAVYPEFKTLNDSEMRLGFYYACKGSVYINLKEENRITDILIKQKDLVFKNEQKSKFINLDFTEELEISFITWSKFVPDIRLMGYNAIYSIMKDCLKVANEDLDKYIQTDVSDLKTMMSMKIEVAKNIGEIIRQVEQGFGVAKKYRKEESESKLTELEKNM